MTGRELPLADRPLELPAQSRLAADHPLRAEILAAHTQAVHANTPGYLDPASGLFVLTAAWLAARGTCCEHGCRHCPYLAEGRAEIAAMEPFDDVLTANAAYAQQFRDSGRPGKAARGLAIVTCMDSRISPLEMLGLQTGDAKILRNAGARVTDDVLRTLILAVHLLDVHRILVVAHSDCRMTKVTDAEVHSELLARGIDTRSLEFRTITDQLGELAGDVQRIRSSPYLPASLPVAGCVYDVSTGRLEIVVPPA